MTNGNVNVKVTSVGGEGAVSKASSSTQLPDRRTREWAAGVRPPYDPERLAAFSELNETLAVGVRKKARYEVGYGFDLVPHGDLDAEEADDAERETAVDFWYGIGSSWQTKANQRAEPSTPEEVLELARQDYHLIGYACIEVLVDRVGQPTGLAHVPAHTVRVRKPQSQFGQPRHPETGEFAGEGIAKYGSRGYIQKRQGRRRYFGEIGDRYDRKGDERIFVDRETGDVATGSAERLENAPANELLFVTNPSPLADDYGVPDWVSAIRTIVSDEAAKNYNQQFFDNDTIPRFVIKVTGGELSQQSRNDLRQMLHGLREESHRAVTLEVEKFANDNFGDQDVDIELKPLGQGISEEMDFRQFREKNEHEIAKVLEVPPVKIGVTDSANRSNSEVQDREFALEVIQPEQHKFAERLYRTLHQLALDVSDWTIQFQLRGTDHPGQDAKVARQKIQAVQGAVPLNRALEMIGEDPLPEDHPVDGTTLVANVGDDATASAGDSDGGSDRPAAAPPPADKLGERDWNVVEANLRTKDPIEQVQFDSSNLAEGLFDFGEQELYLSFQRSDGQNSLYVYVDVPTSEWQSLVTAGSHGSYHYHNIRLEYPYEEVTNFHDRLPEGPSPDSEEIPDDIPT